MGKYFRFALLGGGLVASIMHAAEMKHYMLDQNLSQMQAQGALMRSEASDKSLRSLARLSRSDDLAVAIPKKELVDAQGKSIPVKELLHKYNIAVLDRKPPLCKEVEAINPWDDPQWSQAFWRAMYAELDRQEEHQKNYTVSELPGLVKDAKQILKSFLTDNDELALSPLFMKKPGSPNRLFTYAAIERAIRKKHLTHVRLPIKVLLIKDRRTGKYLTKKEASDLIDSLKVGILMPKRDNESLKFNIFHFLYGLLYRKYGYDLEIFARIQPKLSGLSEAAFKDLQEVIRWIPFDVGYGNIFADAQGDAVIIDTEYKNASVENALPKLERYGMRSRL